MKDKEQIKYYKDHNILKGPNEFDNSNSREPSKKCPFCGEEQNGHCEVDIRDLDSKYIKIPFKYLLYYGLIKCKVRECNNCGAIWHGDLFVDNDKDLFVRSLYIICTLIFIISGIILFMIIPKPVMYGVLLLLFLVYIFFIAGIYIVTF